MFRLPSLINFRIADQEEIDFNLISLKIKYSFSFDKLRNNKENHITSGECYKQKYLSRNKLRKYPWNAESNWTGKASLIQRQIFISERSLRISFKNLYSA